MKFLLYFFLLIFISAPLAGQETPPSTQSIENQLELLEMNYPEYGEKVNVNITHTTLANFLLAISEIHGININVSPELNEISIINNFSDVSIKDLLLFLMQEYNLDVEIIGNIISVSKLKIPEVPVKNEILAEYEPTQDLLTLDIKNDPLEMVFRKITNLSGKNLVFAPGLEDIPLSVYLLEVPFESAMEKLAMANSLEVTKSRDGFYIFYQPTPADGSAGISISDNFYYRVLDSINNIIEVDFKNVPVSEIIYSLGEDLNINYYTASSLENLGTVSVSAENIEFDHLLDLIFESVNASGSTPGIGSTTVNPRQNPQMGGIPTTTPGENFTYKKEGNIYYFGTENQLVIKTIEIIPMMHRSIELLSNPEGRSRRRNNDYNNFVTGNTNYFPGNNNYQNLDERTGIDLGINNEARSGSETVAIQKIIPDELQQGLDIKIDSELNSFVVSGPAAKVERFKKFIRYIDKPVPVILIEVMIIEVNKTATVETGVTFGLGDEPIATEGQTFPSVNMQLGAQTINRVIGGFDGFSSLNIGKVLPNFYMTLKAMETNGNLKILSTPKLSTLNGHKAYLSSGETTYYAVTNQSFFGSQIPQATQITNYYPIDAELALEIMPFVSGDGQITLDIKVIQSSFTGERIAENAPPGMNTREFSSIIRMRDQDIAILGGIETRIKDDSGSGVPLLARIPVIKWLFSERRREDSKKKLNILIKPTVIY